MTTVSLKKQVDNYLPLLISKQQALVLEMIKSFLSIESDTKKLTENNTIRKSTRQ